MVGVSIATLLLLYYYITISWASKQITDEIYKTGDKVLLSDDNQANLTIYVGGCIWEY